MAVIRIKDAGQEREDEPVVSRASHERQLKEREHLTHLVKVQRDNFQKLSIVEGDLRIKLQKELETMKSSYLLVIYLLAASMLGNIGAVICLTP